MRILSPRPAVFVLVGSALATLSVGACKEGRESFAEAARFEQDASTAAECLFRCSLDGRSVVQTCTGEVVETCSPELACGAGTCQEPCAAAAADRSSNGCEFYFQPPMFDQAQAPSCYAAYVVNTSQVPVDVSLEYQGEPLDVSKSLYRTAPGSAALVPHVGSLAAGDSAILFISDATSHAGRYPVPCPDGVVPATLDYKLPGGTGIGSSFRVSTNVPVSLTAIYPFGGAQSFAPSATLLLPVTTWGNQHIIVNAWERRTMDFPPPRGPVAQIVASEDETEVTILPTRNIQDGPGVVGSAARVPVTYRLGKGQLLQINQAEELSGSVVTSNKPTSVFGGHECMYVPSSRPACDAALQQLPSLEQWGSEYVGVGYRPRLGDEGEMMPYRIVAARDETRLDYDPAPPPGAPTTMSAGEVVTFWAAAGNAFVVRTQDADHPVYLAAYMSSSGENEFHATRPDFLGAQHFMGRGDPEFVNVVPAGQYLSSYSFFADPTYDETSLVIVRAKTGGEFKDVWLECAGTLTDFRPVGTRGDYEYVRVDLIRDRGPGQAFNGGVCQSGLQRMRSDGAFTATVWGWGTFASYAYPGGMALRKLVETPLPPIR